MYKKLIIYWPFLALEQATVNFDLSLVELRGDQKCSKDDYP